MLKIEKNEHIEIKLSSKDSFFNKHLKIGLVIALGFHLLAFTIVTVKPLGRVTSDLVFPPVMVNAEIETPAAHVLSSVDYDGPSRRFIPTPPLPQPEIGGPEKVDISKYIEPFDISKQLTIPIPEMDEKIDCETSSYPIYDHRIVVNISGPAGELKWKNPNITKEFLHQLPKGAHHLTYDIRVCTETGSIIWFQGDESTLASDMVKKIELEPSQKPHFVIPGHLDIYTYYVRY